ncbi:MAG: EAL domain-containing protein [Gammaproteobacteria bacterium]|nr:EAL domain-containing protein [Gammaproteobacteria bacterium]
MSTSTLLIVDDEPSNLATLKQILAPSYSLVFARNGTEALAAAEKHRPALILLDIQMPDMDGYSVCKKLKADESTEDIPVIFVSSLSEVGHEAAGFECGAVDYIVKPVSPALVHARVRTHISLVRTTMLERYIKQLEVQQEKIARLNRIQAVLSAINSAIVRIRDRQALFDETCRIAADYGEFDTAWIGLCAADDSVLTPVAYMGIELNRLQDLLKTSELQGSFQPCVLDQALTSRSTAFRNDISTIAHPSPLCRDALEHGYRSIIALPLVPQAQTVGVMVLYARAANFFDEAELKLLNELGGDIAFALNHIEQEERVNYLSYYDTLTGLPNNSLFLDRLGQIIQSARHERNTAFVVIINLDRFKLLNDTLGRHVGDQVLKTVGERLSRGLSRPFTAARLASDNFALAWTRTPDRDVAVWVGLIADLLDKPMLVEGRELHLSVHMGIAAYPLDGEDAESLFKNAEAALKQAKANGERHAYYSPEISARMAEKIELERLLRTALDQRQFVLFYQPKVDLRTGRIASAEALIRWRHPQRGIILPKEFIPLAEETELIVPIGDWIIHTVCAQQLAWQTNLVNIVPVAINLSALQFKKGQVQEFVRQALLEYRLKSDFVELELTESLVMQNLQEAEKIMREFRAMGLRLSLDDFGTGYSSLAYLKRFPFDTVKIDQAFISDVNHNPEDAAIATAIIAMAHSLQMNVIAEGVETEAQLNFLRVKGCDQIQGYFFSKPVSADEFEAMLRSDKRLVLDPDLNRVLKNIQSPH